MFNKISKLLGASALVLSSLAANAGVITVWGEELSGFNKSTINDFYNGLAGHSSSIATGSLDTIDLSTTDLLWATQPSDSYSNAELLAMQSYLALGGRIAFMGEHGSFAPDQNLRINDALSFLGSSISINNDIVDAFFRTASVGDGQILSHELTQGVNSYEYAAFAPLTVGVGAEVLMVGEELFNGETSVMMAFENIGAGSIFLITDQNVWDNSPGWGGTFDNARMFENLVTANTGAPAPTSQIPEPASIMLMSLALFGIRRQFRR
ncbi:PEP-CTERM sorting domain-containing protein [Thalassotalea euphylliae]|uniref:PEP-CTERM sorting domain-containing protein n=1 Tax=Thalassotalea euphylliae TaxID=1655234 RepID=UPI003625A63F